MDRGPFPEWHEGVLSLGSQCVETSTGFPSCPWGNAGFYGWRLAGALIIPNLKDGLHILGPLGPPRCALWSAKLGSSVSNLYWQPWAQGPP